MGEQVLFKVQPVSRHVILDGYIKTKFLCKFFQFTWKDLPHIVLYL